MASILKQSIVITPETNLKRTITLRLLKPKNINGRPTIQTKTMGIIVASLKDARYVIEVIDEHNQLPFEVMRNANGRYYNNKYTNERALALQMYNNICRFYELWQEHEDSNANISFWNNRNHPWQY